jgi:hypothetical protein
VFLLCFLLGFLHNSYNLCVYVLFVFPLRFFYAELPNPVRTRKAPGSIQTGLNLTGFAEADPARNKI